MVESVKWSFMRPGVCSRVKTFVSEMSSVHFTQERKRPIKMSVPCYRAYSEQSDGGEGSTRIKDGLEKTVKDKA